MITQAVRDNARTGLERGVRRLNRVIKQLRSGNPNKIKKHLERLDWVFTKDMSWKRVQTFCSTFASSFVHIRDTMQHGTYEFTYRATNGYYAETVAADLKATGAANRSVEMNRSYLPMASGGAVGLRLPL